MALFIKFDGIEGESLASGHEKWIDVLSWSWGASQPSERMAAGAGAGKAGTPSIQVLSIGKRLDKSSPLLYQSCAAGKVIKLVTLDVVEERGSELKLSQLGLELKLTNTLVSSVRTSQDLNLGDDTPPLEVLTLNFSKVDMTYNEYDAAGKLLSSPYWRFDLTRKK